MSVTALTSIHTAVKAIRTREVKGIEKPVKRNGKVDSSVTVCLVCDPKTRNGGTAGWRNLPPNTKTSNGGIYPQTLKR